MPGSKRPTVKQRGFVFSYRENGSNASKAYRDNYNCIRMKEKTITRNAHELLKNNNVATMLAELEAEDRERHGVTIDSLTIEYEEAREIAKGEAQPAAMVSATTGKARIHGLLVEKKEISGPDGGPVVVTVRNDIDGLFAEPTD